MEAPLIESVEPIEFRGIKRCRKPVKLSRFTVLIGRNNSGKTSILEAISMLPVFSFGEPRFPPTEWNTTTYMEHLHGGLNSLIYGYTGRTAINYVFHDGMEVTWVYGLKEGIEILGASKDDVIKLVGAETESQARSSILLLPNDTRFLVELAGSLKKADEWARVVKSGANVSIVELIDKVVHDRFTETLVQFDEITLRKELPDKRVIYVRTADLGDGVERVLIYGLWLETYKPRVVLWDDLEASAHPGLVEAVLEWLAGRDWQVVLTTHSYDVLERLVAVEPDDASVVVLRKGADDVLDSRVLSLDELRRMIESHMDVRRVVDIV